jgi:hypothetical protein
MYSFIISGLYTYLLPLSMLSQAEIQDTGVGENGAALLSSRAENSGRTNTP